MKRAGLLSCFAALAASCLLAALPAAAQQVTLPLSQFEDLRTRANPGPEKPPDPPVPFALESADFEIAAGPSSARIAQTLALTVYADGWQKVPLGAAGSFTAARFGGLEGRVEVEKDDWSLHVRGRGRHEVSLESVVPMERDATALRPSWRFDLKFPPAAVVRGSLRAPAEVEEVEIDGAGLVQKADSGAWSFVSAFQKDGVGFVLQGRRTLPERARLPLRFEATSATSATLSRVRLRTSTWLRLTVGQGQLEEVRVPLPQGLEVVGVQGPIAGWNVDAGTLIVTPLEPVESSLEISVQMAGEPQAAFATPVLIPAGSRRTLFLSRAALQGDGLLRLADPDAVRSPEEAEMQRLDESLRRQGDYLVVLDPARPARWDVEWADDTQVLAAQVDRLLVDVAVGEGGRAAYQLWAVVRNRGAQQLLITLPAGFELVAGSRDREPVAAGSANSSGASGIAVPLLVGEERQVVHLAGILPMPLPDGSADLRIPLPALSAPAATVDVRVGLPGDRSYTLADTARIAAVAPPPAPGRLGPSSDAVTNQIAKSVLANSAGVFRVEASGAFPHPPGYREVTASWSALSATPQPLEIRAREGEEDQPWF